MGKTSSDTNLFIDLNAQPMQNPTDQIPTHDLMEELNRMKWENKKLNDMLTIVCKNYSDLMQKQSGEDIHENQRCNNPKKRKLTENEIENFGNHSCCCTDQCSPGGFIPKDIKSNVVSRVHVRINPSDTSLIVKDGYQWKKYGQKVTRDNPSPRAYYKCSLSPTCPVKKKVQRSANDPSLLVAVYEGQHNHRLAGGEISTPAMCSGNFPASLDPTDPIICSEIQSAIGITTENTAAIHKFLVEKMVSSLTSNHSFTTALAEAITCRILDDLSDDDSRVV